MYAYKKPLTTLFLLYILTNPLQAANIIDEGEDDQKEGSYAPTHLQEPSTVHDHTFLNHKNIKHILDDIEDIEDELEDTMLNVNRKLITTDNQSPPLLLAVVLQHQQSHNHYQYLITNTGLLPKITQPNAVKKAHKKGFHLIKATPGHVILQLLEWLQISKHYIVIALHTNRPVCRNCHLIANSLWKKELQTNEKGCFSTPFPLLGKMPNLAHQYINTHFHLSFVKSLVVPMMGYVSKEEMNKAIEEKDEKINMLNHEINKKDNQLNDKTQQITTLQAQALQNQNALNSKNQRIETLTSKLNNKNQRIKNLNNQLNNKQKLNNKKQKNKKNQQIKTHNKKITISQAHQEINKYKNHLSKDIAAKLKRLRTEFDINLDDIHTQNKNSVQSFVQKANVQIKEGFKQLNEDMQTLREYYKKYKGDDLKYFGLNDKNHKYSKYGATYAITFTDIKANITSVLQQIEKEEIFSSILLSLKTLLPIQQARLCGVNKVLEQNSFKNQNYRLEVHHLNAKLELGIETLTKGTYWKWTE